MQQRRLRRVLERNKIPCSGHPPEISGRWALRFDGLGLTSVNRIRKTRIQNIMRSSALTSRLNGRNRALLLCNALSTSTP